MAKQKVAVTLDRQLLMEIDDLVASGAYPNRSQAIEAALAETLARRARTQLIRECARLDPAEERALAEEGLGAEGVEWPAY
ncbi:MAG TPA: ribbon-helix-helix protein, CopG family [Gemmatimonadaceae bacterium]|nr:ribbon-helix-helix protein, CopG family [Gemmatimonadaceae bacterium]